MPEAVQPSIEQIIAKLQELAPAIRAEGVTRLAVFGSRTRGDHRPDSDLDILIESVPYAPDAPLFDMFKVMHMIEDNIGLTTQITFATEMTPRFAERISDDLVEIF